jgi:mannose-6-phosphate isomerase-like protein (cupin superfamily)
MATATQPAFDLVHTYFHLADGGGALPIEVTETFWQELQTGDYRSEETARVANGDGWLVTKFHMANDSPTWEMHPAGDELLYLLSGAMEVILEERDGKRIVELHAGGTCLVPRGAWHRPIVRTPGDLLAITYGRGTQNRPA